MAENGTTPDIPASPLPTAMTVMQLTQPDQSWVLLRAQSPQGTFIFFLPPEQAAAIGKLICDVARFAKSGLTMPHPKE